MIQTQEKDYSRDPSNLALINTNIKALREHKLKKEQELRLRKVETELEIIKNTLEDFRRNFSELGIGK